MMESSMTYILMAPEGFKLSTSIAYPVGIVFALGCLGLFLKASVLKKDQKADKAA